MPAMSETFSFSHAEAGWIFGSFNVAYALFQIPGGCSAMCVGSRRALTLIAITWGVADGTHRLRASPHGSVRRRRAHGVHRNPIPDGRCQRTRLPAALRHHRKLVSARSVGVSELGDASGTGGGPGRYGPTDHDPHSEGGAGCLVLHPCAARAGRGPLLVVVRQGPRPPSTRCVRRGAEVHLERTRRTGGIRPRGLEEGCSSIATCSFWPRATSA